MAETHELSEEYRQKMFDNVKKEFIQENGVSNGDTTKRSDIDRKSTRLNSSHYQQSRMPSSA